MMSEIKITGEDLISKAKEIIQNLIDTGAKSWSLHIPARINEDPDLVLSRVVTEYETTIENLKICQSMYKQEFDSHGVTRKELKKLQEELLQLNCNSDQGYRGGDVEMNDKVHEQTFKIYASLVSQKYYEIFDLYKQNKGELQELQDELLKVSRSALMSLRALSPLIKKHIEASKRRNGE